MIKLMTHVPIHGRAHESQKTKMSKKLHPCRLQPYNKAIDKREDSDTGRRDSVILKEIKQTKETLDMTPADRTEIIEECNKRLAVPEQYVSKMMDEVDQRSRCFCSCRDGTGCPRKG